MKLRRSLVLLLFSTTVPLAACSNGPAVDPELTSIYENVIQGGCDSESCHGGSTPVAELDFTSIESAYAGLIGIESTQEPQYTRVIAGNSDDSLLYLVLLGDVGTISQMPPGFSLTVDEIEAIREWIDLGAENN